ncbi:MAG TPA: type II toxin-antitoxin system VapC family toxin [Rhodothermales bacterium]|nr:type II toxin-antitoxin system VapC family toxin [Rhodothermales bacterium]
MVVDTSAVIAILQDEPGSNELVETLIGSAVRRVSAANLLESAMVMQARYGDAGEGEVDVLFQRLRVEIVPVTAQHAEIARSAFRRYGKGRHPAGLNFGDCFAYALSKAMAEPLLFVGEDFGLTDVDRV